MVNMEEASLEERIVKLLPLGKRLSGEFLAQQLGVSRVAVWKCVRRLRKRGVKIKSGREGYLLDSAADILLPFYLRSRLEGRTIGRNLVYRDMMVSTQTVGRKLADGGEKEGAVVLAEAQSASYGRLGRPWVSARGGLWFTVILRPDLPPASLQAFNYMASLSVYSTLRADLGVDAWLKWPNDVFVRGDKVCGIISEAAATSDSIRYVLLGVGLNVNNEMAEVGPGPYRAASMAALLGRFVDRNELLVSILTEMDSRYAGIKREGITRVVREYSSRCATLGRRVKVILGDRSFEGVVAGINDEGALEVDTGKGITRVYAGDVVHLR